MSDNARVLASGIEALQELTRRKKERIAWEWWENEWKRPGDYAAYPTQREMLTCGANHFAWPNRFLPPHRRMASPTMCSSFSV